MLLAWCRLYSYNIEDCSFHSLCHHDCYNYLMLPFTYPYAGDLDTSHDTRSLADLSHHFMVSTLTTRMCLIYLLCTGLLTLYGSICLIYFIAQVWHCNWAVYVLFRLNVYGVLDSKCYIYFRHFQNFYGSFHSFLRICECSPFFTIIVMTKVYFVLMFLSVILICWLLNNSKELQAIADISQANELFISLWDICSCL